MNNLLSGQVLGRIGFVKQNKPCIIPVTYAYDGKFIYGQTNTGSKLEAMRKHPDVCFEVERMVAMNSWESVIIEGKFEELKDQASKKARDILFGKVYTLSTSSTIHPYEHSVDYEPDDSNRVKHVMYRIRIHKMTGRFEQP